MKSFFAAFVGTLMGLGAFFALVVGVAIGALVILFSSSAQRPVVPIVPGSYLVLSLDGVNLTDAPPAIEEGGLASLLTGDAPVSLSLRSAVDGLRAAASDDRIVGVWITGSFAGEGYGTGLAALRELRSALGMVRAAGKPVRAYFNNAGLEEYYLASVADRVALMPSGLLFLPGLSAEPMFFGDAFKKWGVGVQVTRTGKYKSWVEPFLRRDMSEESREQLSGLLSDTWGSLREEIAAARGLAPQAVQKLVDEEGLIEPEVALAAGLIDAVCYRDEELDALREETGVEEGEVFRQVDFADYLAHAQDVEFGGGPQVAVVYAEGDIVDGEGYEGEVGGSAYARELRSLRENPDVAAVVLRINSPGGSAGAAEEMLRELRLLREVKPVVVSMGSYAESGGYWIAAYAHRIYCEPTTVTGSIGVFGVQFDLEKLGERIGLTWDRVQVGEKAGMLTVARPKTEAELAVFQRLVDRVYADFISRVAEGRGLTPERVHEIAQGRVWTGGQAVELGLADEVGGLGDAMAHAASLAKLGERPAVYEYPSTRRLGDVLTDWLAGRSAPQAFVRSGPFGEWWRKAEGQLRTLARFNDPQGVYARLPLDLRR